MAYRQYTQCVEIENFTHITDGISNGIIQAALQGLYLTLTPAAFVTLLAILGAASGWCLLFLVDVYFMAATVYYCYWWLYRRLICIPAPPDHPADSAGDHLAIGQLINIEAPFRKENSFFDNFDNDYSIGILPCPLPLGATRSEIVADSLYGYLLEEQPVTRDHGLPYAGESAIDTKDECADKICSEVLHCEFEGRGMYDMFLAAQVGLFLAVAALFACFVIPEVGWIIAIILALLSFVALAVGRGVLGHDQGDPSDVNPNLTELQLNDCNHKGADTLLIKGHWVYDSLHTGAYELHPVTFACIDNCPKDPGDVILHRKRWQVAIDDATSPSTLENQKEPQNQWQVHPIIDGCQPPIIV